jgi:hypothetical protein
LSPTARTAAAIPDIFLAQIEDFVKLRTIIVPLLAAAALASGCATPDARSVGSDSRSGSVHSNEGYYAVIVSIEPGPDGRDGDAHAVPAAGASGGRDAREANGQQDAYAIRLKFDDNSQQTVFQAGLDGLRVGDSVRIERGRVHRY